MALINSEITPRSYEIIRDQLAAIVTSELVQQAAITYDDLFLAPVYLQRAKNISVEECPLINIAVDSGKYDNQTVIDSDGEFTFFIDVFTTSTYTTTKRGDELSSKEAQRLAGVIQGILSNPQYVTLGFARPFIMRSKVVGFEPGTITKDESTNLAVVRITLSVKAIQIELVQQPISEFEISTQVFLYETEQGYLYSGVGAPLPPPSPTCEPVTVYDTDGNLLGTKESGGAFIVNDSTIVLINSLGDEISQTDVLATETKQITAPDANYRVLDQNATVLATGSIPSNDNQDVIITITNKTYSITDTDGNVLYSGTVTANLVQAIQDATVTNSDSSFTSSILAEGSLVLPDITVNVLNSLDDIVDTQTVPSVQDVNANAPDATVNIKKTGDGTIVSIIAPSGVETNYEVANNAITVNGANDFEIKATDPLDIVLTDGSSSVTPTSVTYNAATHHVDIVLPSNSPTYASARLLKTGQTTSYRTGDDGDFEAGRSASFLTLLANNPFGNTNRFTDTLGGSTYANSWVIDWSTYNGTSVLGYYLISVGLPNVNWNTAIDSAQGTFGGFSGCRLPNKRELEDICNYQLTQLLNYAPFNYSGVTWWCSTTYAASTTLAYTLSGSWVNLATKTDVGGRYLPCRNFTVTGTTLS